MIRLVCLSHPSELVQRAGDAELRADARRGLIGGLVVREGAGEVFGAGGLVPAAISAAGGPGWAIAAAGAKATTSASDSAIGRGSRGIEGPSDVMNRGRARQPSRAGGSR